MFKNGRIVAGVFGALAAIALAVILFGYPDGVPGPDGEETGIEAPESTGVAALSDAPEIIFGFDLRSSLEEDARQYILFLKYLERATGYRFQIRITPEGGNLDEDLGRGVVDLAAVGAVSYLHASKKFGVVPLVRGLNRENKASYRSIIVVAPDSTIKSVADLKGRRFAFGSESSTQGHIIPRGVLLDHGITLDSLAAYEYTGSHQECANAVMTGKYDACGMQDTMARALAEQDRVKILFESRDYPSSGVAATKDMPEDMRNNIRRALLAFDPMGAHAAGLYNWGQTEMPNGFTPASDADYAVFRQQMTDMGLLQHDANEL